MNECAKIVYENEFIGSLLVGVQMSPALVKQKTSCGHLKLLKKIFERHCSTHNFLLSTVFSFQLLFGNYIYLSDLDILTLQVYFLVRMLLKNSSRMRYIIFKSLTFLCIISLLLPFVHHVLLYLQYPYRQAAIEDISRALKNFNDLTPKVEKFGECLTVFDSLF